MDIAVNIDEKIRNSLASHWTLWSALSAFLAGFLLLVAIDAPLPLDPLFGEEFLPSFASLLMAMAVMMIALFFLSRNGIDSRSQLLFILFACVSLHFLHASDNAARTNDWRSHLSFIRYILSHWMGFYEHPGNAQGHQTPFYYIMAALAVKISQMSSAIPQLTAIRFFSWICYQVFAVFALLTVRVAGLSRMAYFSAAALALLWPAGLHISTKISNEPFYFAFYSIAFYYLFRWYQLSDESTLVKAVIFIGLAFMTRSNAVILFLLLAIYLLGAWRQGRIHPRQFVSQRWLGVIVVLTLCAAGNMCSLLMGAPNAKLSTHWGTGEGPRMRYVSGHFYTFHPDKLIETPFNEWQHDQSFWDYVARTSIFGEYNDWGWPELACILNGLLVLLLIYMILPWFIAKRSDWRNTLPIVTGLCIPMGFLLIYAYIMGAEPNQDFRFIYPSLVCFALWVGRSQQLWQSKNNWMACLGSLAVWSFVGLSVVFFWSQTR